MQRVAVARALVMDPDVILADWENGDELSTEISDGAPEAALVVMADDPGLPGIAEALRSGVRAVLSRHASASPVIPNNSPTSSAI